MNKRPTLDDAVTITPFTVEEPPHDQAPPHGEPIEALAARFKLDDWNDIDFDPNEEWRVEDILPMRGLGLIYGKPRSFKSFVAMHLALHVVLGLPWAGKCVEKGKVVYHRRRGRGWDAQAHRGLQGETQNSHEETSPSYRSPRTLGRATATSTRSLPRSKAPASSQP